MITAILTAPDFAEICFLIAFVLCVISVLFHVIENAPAWAGTLLTAAVGLLSLGFLAL